MAAAWAICQTLWKRLCSQDDHISERNRVRDEQDAQLILQIVEMRRELREYRSEILQAVKDLQQ